MVREIDNFLLPFLKNPVGAFLNCKKCNNLHYETNQITGVQKKIPFQSDPKVRKLYSDVEGEF